MTVPFQNAAMALVLLSAQEGKIMNDYFDMSTKIKEIKKICPNPSTIYVQRTAAGYYSPTFDSFVGSFELAGDVTKRSPFSMNNSGTECCKKIVQHCLLIYPYELEKIAGVLNVDLKHL